MFPTCDIIILTNEAICWGYSYALMRSKWTGQYCFGNIYAKVKSEVGHCQSACRSQIFCDVPNCDGTNY